MRLFVGLPLASEVLNELSEAVSRLKASHDGLRWTTPDTWHITLQFLGNTDQEHCDCVLAGLAHLRSPPFEVRLDDFGSFDRAGVFFLDVVPTRELVALAQQVIAATGKCGFVAETRPYHPHITLARAKAGRGRPLAELKERVRRPKLFPSFTATEFLLYESHTLPEGACYEMRGRFPLIFRE
jgi:2'-5' RNA ligase